MGRARNTPQGVTDNFAAVLGTRRGSGGADREISRLPLQLPLLKEALREQHSEETVAEAVAILRAHAEQIPAHAGLLELRTAVSDTLIWRVRHRPWLGADLNHCFIWPAQFLGIHPYSNAPGLRSDWSAGRRVHILDRSFAASGDDALCGKSLKQYEHLGVVPYGAWKRPSLKSCRRCPVCAGYAAETPDCDERFQTPWPSTQQLNELDVVRGSIINEEFATDLDPQTAILAAWPSSREFALDVLTTQARRYARALINIHIPHTRRLEIAATARVRGHNPDDLIAALDWESALDALVRPPSERFTPPHGFTRDGFGETLARQLDALST
jgi:hypothetical protein